MPTETVVLELARMDEVEVQADLVYKTVADGELLFDVYRPPSGERAPVVVFVHGDGPPEFLADAKDWGQYTSWGRLAGASGLAGVTFNHRSSLGATELEAAASDVDDLVANVREQADELGLDADRMCLWTCSAGGPIGMREEVHRRAPLHGCRDEAVDRVVEGGAVEPGARDEQRRRLTPVRRQLADGRELLEHLGRD